MCKLIHRRDFLKLAGGSVFLPALFPATVFGQESPEKPNIVFIFTDDQGYGDVGCFGAQEFETPNIDQMAQNGIRFTSFYAQPICGPSRAALMTGCYPMRIAEPGNFKRGHNAPHPREIFLSEMLKEAGYKTGCFGKWHLGWQEGQRPWEKGFDEFYGTPYYNGFFKTVEDHEDFTSIQWVDGKPKTIHKSFTCQLWNNSKLVEKVDTFEKMGLLTSKYTRKAIDFISENKNRPFFLYLAHNMPHIPLGASEKFLHASGSGLYGDVIEEIDWSVGRILEALKENQLERNTLVIFTSDNGPWIEKGRVDEHGGSAKPLRGFKMSTWEGGFRVPCVMQWPGKIPQDIVCDEMATTMDFFATFAHLANGKLPADRTLDSRNILPLLRGGTLENPRQVFYYYLCTHLQAVRIGNWKLVVPRQKKPPFLNNYGRLVDQVDHPLLFNLENDKEEQHDLSKKYPEKVKELYKYYNAARTKLGDYDRIGSEQRFFDTGPKRSDIGEKIN